MDESKIKSISFRFLFQMSLDSVLPDQPKKQAKEWVCNSKKSSLLTESIRKGTFKVWEH